MFVFENPKTSKSMKNHKSKILRNQCFNLFTKKKVKLKEKYFYLYNFVKLYFQLRNKTAFVSEYCCLYSMQNM